MGRDTTILGIRGRGGRRAVVAALWVALACDHGKGIDASVPPAQLYSVPSDFGGTWAGEVAGAMGTLEIKPLGAGRYRAVFRSDDETVEYVMALDQAMLPGPGSQSVGGNRALFTWQDGRGGRGGGWLLINREDSALTGSYGGGETRRSGAGDWTFIRLE